ncbi:unnamed protein product, partial [Didymodactylos carnosus]
EAYCESGLTLVLGVDSVCRKEDRACSVQGLGGTGTNHETMLKEAGFEVREYRYWNKKTFNIDFVGLLEDLEDAPAKSVILLHGCAHNPTGCDPTKEQWQQIAEIIQRRHLFPFFDLAYQGFASGDLDEDAWSIRYFADTLNLELFVAQSFSKNLGLYSDRIGQLIACFHFPETVPIFLSQITLVVSRNYLTPPQHGAEIVSTVLNTEELYQEWILDVRRMYSRIQTIRQKLYTRLNELGTPGTWTHIITQTGMFAFTGLNPQQCRTLVHEHHCYIPSNGRVNMCAITKENVDHVAESVHQVIVTLHRLSRHSSELSAIVMQNCQ